MTSEQGDWADRAVQVMAAMGRRTASELRKLAPEPIGLINDQLALPAFVGSYTQEVSTAVTSMTLFMAHRRIRARPTSQSSPTSPARHSDTVSLTEALGGAIGNENARQAGALEHRPVGPPPGPVERGHLEIVVAGQARSERTQSYSGFHAVQFAHSGLLVQAIARGHWPHQPAFAVVTDLAPYLVAMEAGDPDVIKAQLRARYPHRPPQPGS